MSQPQTRCSMSQMGGFRLAGIAETLEIYLGEK